MLSGYVASLNHPGGNVTGVHILNPQALLKRLEALHDLVPLAKKIALFYTETGEATESPFYKDVIQKAAETLGIKLVLHSASKIEELEKTFCGC